jgi:hypothetical protein
VIILHSASCAIKIGMGTTSSIVSSSFIFARSRAALFRSACSIGLQSKTSVDAQGRLVLAFNQVDPHTRSVAGRQNLCGRYEY